jgi:MarR family transcriptional regulator, organic hydroperoxide resistance regulator
LLIEVIVLERFELEKYINRLQGSFYSTMRTLGPELSEHLEEGLTGDQFFVLRILQNKGRVSSSDLAEEFQVKPSAITAMVERMYKNEFVTRERDEKDRRVVYIKITKKGENVLQKSHKKRNEIIEKYMSQLEPEELEGMVNAFEKLAQIIQSSKESEHK